MSSTKFKSGDKVVFCKSSLESGMIDAKEGDVFTIKECLGPECQVISLKELSGYYHKTHFEHYVEKEKEKVMEKYIPKVGDKVKGFKFDSGTDGVGYDAEMDGYVEEVGEVVDVYTDSFVVKFPDSLEWMYPASLAHLAKIEESCKFEDSPQETSHEDGQIDWQGSQINWQVGQEVWDTRYSIPGKVERVGELCLEVQFKFGVREYYKDGVQYGNSQHGVRSLFFSEPKIIAETMPPKKPFVPVLKEGVDVFIKTKSGVFGEGVVRTVYKETEDRICTSEDGHYFLKRDIESARVLSEQVKFS